MSYYNQPDHENLDRRDEDAREILLRLACADTVVRAEQPSHASHSANGEDSRDGRWLAEASRRGIPAPDTKPLVAGDRSVRCVWRRHYVAAVIDKTDRPTLQAMEDSASR